MFWFKRKGWKFLGLRNGTVHSVSGDQQAWEPGVWYSVSGAVQVCGNGFHCSGSIQDAERYVWGQVIAEVQGAGSRDKGTKLGGRITKRAFRRMRILHMWKWQQEDRAFLSELISSGHSPEAVQKILETMLRQREEI
jgi:hypothetical protein